MPVDREAAVVEDRVEQTVQPLPHCLDILALALVRTHLVLALALVRTHLVLALVLVRTHLALVPTTSRWQQPRQRGWMDWRRCSRSRRLGANCRCEMRPCLMMMMMMTRSLLKWEMQDKEDSLTKGP